MLPVHIFTKNISEKLIFIDRREWERIIYLNKLLGKIGK